MKRAWSALLALLFVFLFCGCKNVSGRGQNPPAIPQSYQADSNISFNGVSISSHIIQNNFENMTVEITSPKELKGFVFIKSSDEYCMNYKSMNYKIELSKFPKASFLSIITRVYESIVNSDGVKFTKKDKYWIYQGNTEFGKFIVTQNDETGFVEKIEVPKAGLVAEFSNIKAIAR